MTCQSSRPPREALPPSGISPGTTQRTEGRHFVISVRADWARRRAAGCGVTFAAEPLASCGVPLSRGYRATLHAIPLTSASDRGGVQRVSFSFKSAVTRVSLDTPLRHIAPARLGKVAFR